MSNSIIDHQRDMGPSGDFVDLVILGAYRRARKRYLKDFGGWPRHNLEGLNLLIHKMRGYRQSGGHAR